MRAHGGWCQDGLEERLQGLEKKVAAGSFDYTQDRLLDWTFDDDTVKRAAQDDGSKLFTELFSLPVIKPL
jgi:hypothetical protein